MTYISVVFFHIALLKAIHFWNRLQQALVEAGRANAQAPPGGGQRQHISQIHQELQTI